MAKKMLGIQHIPIVWFLVLRIPCCLFSDCSLDSTSEESTPPEEIELISTDGQEFPWDDIRLPRFIRPIRYDIELTPDLNTKIVKGK